MFCPICGEDLVMTTEPGHWTCNSGEDQYQEQNNVTICQSQNCHNTIFSSKGSFNSLEEKYCDSTSGQKEIYIKDGLGVYYNEMTCLEFARKGIRKNKEDKGSHLTCIECNGEFRLKNDGYLICKGCGIEIDKNTSMFLSPIYDPYSNDSMIKKFKI